MEQFALRITPDKMKAFIILRPVGSENDITPDKVRSFLESSGVVFGFNNDVVADIIAQKKWDEEVPVAAGKNPEKGADGSVKFMFDTRPPGRPTVREDGRLDFFDLHTAQCVHAGDKLAELIAPSEGSCGTNVLGQTIPAPKGKAAKISKGKNTNFSDETRNVLVTEIDGNVKLNASGAVEVSQSLAINGDIDLTTGNIEVVGDLVVRGDIKAGFKVKASGNIEIGGTVEDAHISADGTIVIKGGFLGEGVGEIKAGRDVFLKYVYRQTVTAGGDIEIIEESTQSHLSAEGCIRVSKGKGMLIGGSARAGKSLEAKVIGNGQNAPTEIIVGGRSDLLKQIENLQKSAKMYEDKLNEVADQMSKLMSKKKKIGLSAKDEEKFRLLDRLSADIERSINAASKELEEREKELEELRKTVYVDVHKKIFPGVTIKMAGHAKYISDEREKTRFKIVGNEIIGIE